MRRYRGRRAQVGQRNPTSTPSRSGQDELARCRRSGAFFSDQLFNEVALFADSWHKLEDEPEYELFGNLGEPDSGLLFTYRLMEELAFSHARGRFHNWWYADMYDDLLVLYPPSKAEETTPKSVKAWRCYDQVWTTEGQPRHSLHSGRGSLLSHTQPRPQGGGLRVRRPRPGCKGARQPVVGRHRQVPQVRESHRGRDARCDSLPCRRASLNPNPNKKRLTDFCLPAPQQVIRESPFVPNGLRLSFHVLPASQTCNQRHRSRIEMRSQT